MPPSAEFQTQQDDREASRPVAPDIAGVENAGQSHDTLKPGHRLDEFEIVRVLGVGGFGIVYLALDQILLRHVAIKEYFPAALASRDNSVRVEARSREAGKTFDLGLESFINEARLLASFDHPSLVKVHRFWKQNGTAYMVMQYYPGQTLKCARRSLPGPPDEAWLRAFIDPLLGALEVLHAQGVFHRDIAPDNILLLPDGQPVILDFGSARRVISDRTQSLTAVLKPNFSPVEQYAEDAGMRQGAYTDLFALGGTVRFMMTGEAPTPAVMRAIRDTLPALSVERSDEFAGVSFQFLAAIDWSLALAPDDRPQTVAELRDALDGKINIPEPSPRYVLTNDGRSTFGPTAAMAKTRLIPRPYGVAAMRTVAVGAPGVKPAPGSGRSERQHVGARRSKIASIALVALSFVSVVGLAVVVGVPDKPAVPKALDVPAVEQAVRAEPQPSAQALLSNEVSSTPAPTSGLANLRASDAKKHPIQASDVRGATEDQLRMRRLFEASAGDRDVTVSQKNEGEIPSAPSDVTGLEECAGLGLFARPACVSRACESPSLRGAPQCMDIQRAEERRQRQMNQ